MRSFVWSQFRFRRRRAAALGVAVLIAATSFVLLTSAAQTSALKVRGSLKSNYRAAYDILVRPQGSKTALERRDGLVRPNYLSGIFGGITLRQWHEIERIRGVDVAAPIANIGYILPLSPVTVSLDRLLNDDPYQVYRVSEAYVGDAGRSHYPGSSTAYVYYTRRDRILSDNNHPLREIFHGSELDPYTPFRIGKPAEGGPFAMGRYLVLFSRRAPQENRFFLPTRSGRVTVGSAIYFPVLVAAIDPVQEARLLHVQRTIVSGRYLRETDRPNTARHGLLVPAIASTRPYVGESLNLTIERLRVPSGVVVPKVLSTPSAYRFLSRLSGQRVKTLRVSPTAIYDGLFNALRYGDSPIQDQVSSFSYWTPANVRYREVRGHLRPISTTNPISIWETPFMPDRGGYWAAPGSNRDVQFRRVTAHVGDNHFRLGVLDLPNLEVVGHYDPAKLPGFSPLSQVPLETYYPPLLEPADAASRRTLHGKPLLPTQNLGDYIQQPPLFLTTLEGAKAFYNPVSFTKVRGKASAPISAIRVRVKGVTGPDALSEERVRAVATQIHDRTSLDVDITAGSSPHPLLVELPKGKFGRPELLLREGWSKKGVAISFARALANKDAALFGLILLLGGFFLANAATASVRARRAEIGTLLTLGWPQKAIFRIVLAELLLMGVAAGIAGSASAAIIVTVFSLRMSIVTTLLVIPVALTLVAVAGAVPALLAAQGGPLDALRLPVVGSGRSRPIRRLVGLAFVNLSRVPARTLVGSGGLFVGVGALTVLLGIQRGFQGSLVGTVLGSAISVQVHGADFVAISLTIVLAGLSVADVLYLNLRERSAELATLRAVGWSDRQIATVIVLEGLGLGLLGSLPGAFAGFTLGWVLLGVPPLSLLVAASLAAAGGIMIAALGSLIPLSQIGRLSPHAVLAAE